jgi:hypothetical protein
MRQKTRTWWATLVLVALAPAFSCGAARAQISTSGAANTSWGSYSWQVDQATTTTTLIAVATFMSPPGLVQIPVAIHAPTTVHEVHGTVTLAVPQSGVNGSIIAQVRDQAGNAIAAVKMEKFGTGAATVPITGTFRVGLSITSLELQFFVDLPGIQIVRMSFVMS